MNRCETCKYFRLALANAQGNNPDAGQGQCWRYPPVPYPAQSQNGQMSVMAVRPPVQKTDGCGDHETEMKVQ